MWVWSNTRNKQIKQIKPLQVNNRNWGEAHQLAIYTAWMSWIRDHRRQIHPVAGRRISTWDLRITNPAPYH